MNNRNARIRLIRQKFCNDSNIKFANILGKEPNTTSNWCREGYSIGRGVASEIASKFNVNIDWILNGNGEMQSSETIIQQIGDNSAHNTQVAGSSEVAVLKERVRCLESLVEEKERTIKILLDKR